MREMCYPIYIKAYILYRLQNKQINRMVNVYMFVFAQSSFRKTKREAPGNI